jgi:hypothetical protein
MCWLEGEEDDSCGHPAAALPHAWLLPLPSLASAGASDFFAAFDVETQCVASNADSECYAVHAAPRQHWARLASSHLPAFLRGSFAHACRAEFAHLESELQVSYASVRTLAHSRKRLPCALHIATLYVCMTHGGGLGSQLYCAACPHTSLVTAQLPPGSTLKPTPAAPRSPCDGIPHTAAALRASPRALSRLHVNARACPRRDWSRSAALPHDAQLATLALKHPNLVLVGDSGVGGGGGRGAADAARTGAPSLGAQPHVPPSMCALVAAQHC